MSQFYRRTAEHVIVSEIVGRQNKPLSLRLPFSLRKRHKYPARNYAKVRMNGVDNGACPPHQRTSIGNTERPRARPADYDVRCTAYVNGAAGGRVNYRGGKEGWEGEGGIPREGGRERYAPVPALFEMEVGHEVAVRG